LAVAGGSGFAAVSAGGSVVAAVGETGFAAISAGGSVVAEAAGAGAGGGWLGTAAGCTAGRGGCGAGTERIEAAGLNSRLRCQYMKMAEQAPTMSRRAAREPKGRCQWELGRAARMGGTSKSSRAAGWSSSVGTLSQAARRFSSGSKLASSRSRARAYCRTKLRVKKMPGRLSRSSASMGLQHDDVDLVNSAIC